MDDEGNLLLKKVELDIRSRPRMALVNALHDWSREWMIAYYAIVSHVDPNSPADIDQNAEMTAQKQHHDSIMEQLPFANVGELSALLEDAHAMGMPSMLAPKRPQAAPPKPPPEIGAQEESK